MTRLTVLVFTLSLCIPGRAGAQTGGVPTPDRIYLVPEIEVSALRAVTTIGGSSAVEAHVDSLDLCPAATVEEAFRELPFLHVRRNSRGEAEISVRGSESRQVAVLVDGSPITLTWDARVDVSVIPAIALRDVVFIRGMSSMLHGPNVLGGVIETRIGQSLLQSASPVTQVALGVDDAGAFGASLTTSVRIPCASGEWGVRGGAGYRDSPGDPLARGVEEPVPTPDDLRGNTDVENLHGFVAARYRGEGGTWLACSASSFLGERGIAAELGVPDENARLWRYPHVSRTLAVVSAGSGLQKSPLGRSGAVEASIGIGRGRTDIDSYASRDYQVIAASEDGKEGTLTFRLAAEQSLGPRGDLRAGFTASDIHHDEVIPEGRFEYQQGLWSAGLETDWRLLESPGALKSLALSAGGALDVSRTPKSGGREALGRVEEWGGRVGLSAVVAEGGAILHASVGRRGRFPSLRELYSGALNRFAPNPDLEPEKLVAAEAGVTTALASGEAQAVVFHHRLADAVVRTTLEDGRFMRVNRDVLRSHGVELVGKYSLASVEMAANLTLQDVELTDTRAAETNRPENIPETFGGFSTRFPLPFGAEGGLGIEYTGEQFAIDPATGGDSRLPAQAIMDASVSRTWRGATPRGVGRLSTVEARCAVDNVCDALLFGAAGLPEPGRRIRLEVRIH